MERLTGKQAQSLMEAVASVYEKKEDCVDKDKKTKHNCAKKVCHKEHGEGACIPGKHTLLEDGTVTHYSVVFEHGVEEMIPVEDLEVLVTEMHEHAEMEGEDLQEVDLKKLYDGVVRAGSAAVGAAGRAVGGAVTKVLQPANNSPEAQAERMGKRRPQNAQQQGVANKTAEVMKNSADLFDIVKGHLIDEGLSEEDALKKMLEMTEEEKAEIVEMNAGPSTPVKEYDGKIMPNYGGGRIGKVRPKKGQV